MFKKPLIADFFTTVSFRQYIETIPLISYRLPFLREGNSIQKFEHKFLNYLGLNHSKIISFYNGRSALYQTLKCIGIKKNDEIIVSGYTCVTVSNAVIQSGGKIIYSDIDKKTLGLDAIKLEKNINENTKVIIIQHTFGKPSNISKILKIAKENDILIIEDCAHSLGSEIKGKKLGIFGDFAIFSTGRDKVISTVTGGLLIINNKNYFTKINKIKKQLVFPSLLLTIRNLNYNFAGYESISLYNFFKLGRIEIYLSRKFGLITEILTKTEKDCKYNDFNLKLPNSLAYLGLKELNRLDIQITNNIKLAKKYIKLINNKNLSLIFSGKKTEINNYYRIPILLKNKKNREKLYNYMKDNGVLLGKAWTGENIVPIGTQLKKAKYISGSCKIAEDISERILTLPNHRKINQNDVILISKLLNNFKNV